MRWLLAALLVAGCLPKVGEEQELRTRVPGTWVGAAPEGTKLVMKLEADGSGEVNGLRGSWEIKVGRILLSNGEHLVPCDLDGDELTCHTPEGDLTLTREDPRDAVSEAAPPAPPAPAAEAKPFAAEKTVPGQPFIAPANGPIGGASFTRPDGWKHDGATVAGRDVHVLQSVEVASATITIGRITQPARLGEGDAPRSYRFQVEQTI